MKEYVVVEFVSAVLVVGVAFLFGLQWWQASVLGLLSFVQPSVVVWLFDHVRVRFEFRP